MRQIAFIGNCQLQSLSQLYQRFSDAADTEVSFLPSYEDLTEERAQALARADVIVEQRLDVTPRATPEGVRAGAERIFVPLVAGGFLWPFAGQPHPRNESLWFLAGGPFDGEMGDSYLNRLLDRGTPPADAAAQYIALDVNSARNLDRLRELVMDRQRARDSACGFDIASLIEEFTPREALFRTPHHPNLRLALALAEQLFHRLGVPASGIARMRQRVRVTPFPKNELPVHPAVAAHFGLSWATETTRYQFHEQGRFTFAEYAHLYAAYGWDRALAEGIVLSASDPERALPLLAEGLIRHPRAAGGWFAYSEALRRTNRLPDAAAAARRGIAAADPTDGRPHYALAHALAAADRLEDAAAAAAGAVARDPSDSHFHGVGIAIAIRRDRLDEAEALALAAVEACPDAAHLHSQLAALLAQRGRHRDALAAQETACRLEPDNATHQLALSHVLLRLDRTADAIAAARRAVALAPDNAGIAGHLQSLLARFGTVDEAEAVLRAQLAADPGAHERLGHLLMQQNRPAEAAESFRAAAALAPGAFGPPAGLTHALARLGQTEAAIEAARAALACDPGFAPLYVHLGNQLRLLRRYEEAAAAYREALARDPAHEPAAAQLRGVLAEAAAQGKAA